MNPSWDMAQGSQGIAHHHEYFPAVDGAVNVNRVVVGALADPDGIIWLMVAPSDEEVNECGMVS